MVRLLDVGACGCLVRAEGREAREQPVSIQAALIPLLQH